MRKTIRKVFFIWDWEEEERWLNEMAAEGWNLVQVGFCRYAFEKGEPCTYQYRLEALNSHAKTQESQEYIRFVKESGVEFIGSYLFWAYFRRKAEDAPFESFSDLKSKVKHIRRFAHIPLVLIPVLTLNIFNSINIMERGLPLLGGVLLGFSAVMLGMCCYGAVKIRNKVKQLEAESDIFE